MSGSAVGNNNQYVDTGLSYMTRRRQEGEEVLGCKPGSLLAGLGSCHVTAATLAPARRPPDRVTPRVLVLNRDKLLLWLWL